MTKSKNPLLDAKILLSENETSLFDFELFWSSSDKDILKSDVDVETSLLYDIPSSEKLYEMLVKEIKQQGWTNKEVYNKYYWRNNKKNKEIIDEILIRLLRIYLYENNYKTKITSELAIAYKEKYGATKAVLKLKEDHGIDITRQGLYKAIKRN